VREDGRSILIQSDWVFPAVASVFGWSKKQVQRCLHCDGIGEIRPDGNALCCDTWTEECDHSHTDGSVDCVDCGVQAEEFIAAASQWLSDNDGATAEDPGYFVD